MSTGTDVGAGRRMTLLEARRNGITFANALQAARELDQEGRLDFGNEPEVVAAIALKLTAKQPSWESFRAIPWEALFAFIERILPLILQLLGPKN